MLGTGTGQLQGTPNPRRANMNFHEGELLLEKGLRHATLVGDLRTLAA
jgi:hypothetical protein